MRLHRSVAAVVCVPAIAVMAMTSVEARTLRDGGLVTVGPILGEES